jgi:AraC-like DNA-binding protein
MVFSLIISITALVAIILAIFNYNKQNNAIYISIFLLIFSLYGLTHFITVNLRDVYWGAVFYINFTPIYLLVGPIIYLYVRQNLHPRKKLNKFDLVHLIPFAIDLIGISGYLFSSFEYKQELIQSLYDSPAEFKNAEFKNAEFHLFFHPLGNYVIRIGSVLGYAFYNLFTFRNFYYQKDIANSEDDRKRSIRWLVLFHILVVITTVSYVFYIINLFSTGEFFTMINSVLLGISAFGICLMGLSLMFFPSILYGISKVSYKPIDPDELYTNNPFYDDLKNRIDAYFVEKQPFLKKKFSRVDLAKALKVPSHQITFCFKYVYESSFPAYKLGYRIEWIKNALTNPDYNDLSIEEIGKRAGFASKSSFFVSFKNQTGMTPSEFREKNS